MHLLSKQYLNFKQKFLLCLFKISFVQNCRSFRLLIKINHVYRSYFADEGIKYNIGRVPIGGTDFSTRKYTYADDKGIPDLNNFDLAIEDSEYKVLLQYLLLILSFHIPSPVVPLITWPSNIDTSDNII